jgi:two-component system chemotaxis response regulator CheY
MEATVLIVDDIDMMRRELRRIVEEHGMTVAGEAADGREGVDKYGRLKPDVVLMDITMPRMDGLEALMRIRSQDDRACVIMCSALGQQRYILKAIRRGARDFVVKPFKPERITGAIRKALQAADRLQ